MRSYGKDREKDKGFEFYFDYVFVTHKVTIFTAKRSLTSKRETQNLTVDLSADETVLSGRFSCKVV